MRFLERWFGIIAAVIITAVMILFTSGCSTPVLDKSRSLYYQGDPAGAVTALEKEEVPERDRILYLMELGTMRQGAGQYQKSTRDYNEASDLFGKMDTLSVSRGAGSMVVNDNMLNFYGYPFERTYLHVFSALSYIAQSDWQGAGVEGRRIINCLKPEVLGDYPKDAFSRYMSGLCMELVDDPSNARVEYRKADKNTSFLKIGDHGEISLADKENKKSLESGIEKNSANKHELICIVMMGRVADYSAGMPTGTGIKPLVHIKHDGQLLGYAYNMVDLGNLAALSEQQVALKKAAKTTARVAGKYVIADQVAQQNEWLGFATWMALLLMEQPDYRHWETLPRYINVGRFACPDGLNKIDLEINGYIKHSYRLSSPVTQRGILLITFDRIL